MLFPTITFAVFFLVVYALNWALMPRLRLWKWFIIAASYVFYGWWDWRLVFLLVAATLVNQALALQVHRALGGRRGSRAAARRWLILTIVVNLVTLGWFKYVDFFASSLNGVLNVFHLGAPLPLLHILLPVGISFLVFRMLTYSVDIYRGQLTPAPALDFAVYTAFFPYLLAGPIARAREFLPQLTSPRNPHAVDSSRAFVLILGGLVKKMLIADYLSTHIVNGLFASPQTYSSWETLWGIIAYSVQIYCDFSAYADIAIGVALLLGFELPANFDAPYTARTIQDFWRRWHITLSSWLRDYLYIPLGGNRKGRGRTYVNLVVTFLLGGLWHGAGWTFVFWGLLHGTGLAVERARMDVRHARGLPEPGRTPGARALQRLWVFVFVSVAWVFFRAESMANAFHVLWRLVAGLGSIGSAVTLPVVGLCALGIAIQYVPRRAIENLEAGFSRVGWVGQGLVLALALFLIDVLGPAGTAEFLYFKF
ncbi:MAG TPA: MBOAT family O-acyltransferase [Thermoleophilia bacterium]|nr:MBOAT family O-acyltransferase [Thermoleophilia bacterium]